MRYTFTHFHLILDVMVANVPENTQGTFVARDQFRPSDLPAVMRKAYDLYQNLGVALRHALQVNDAGRINAMRAKKEPP